ncbi:MAG: apolipoprotein N-acyltransferase [Pseudomonadota bacterium]
MEFKGSILQWPADRPRTSRLIFFLLGASYTTAFAPFSLSLLLPVLLVPVLYVWLTVAPRDAASHAFWFGFGLFLTGTYWVINSIVLEGGAPLPLGLLLMLGLVTIMALWMALTGWLVNTLSHGEPLRLIWVAPAAWVMIEWLRGWVLTGFPWMAIGYSQVGMPIKGFAPVFGVYGASFMLVFSSAALVLVAMSRGGLRGVGVTLALLPWLAGTALSFVNWTEADGDPLRTTVLQVGIPQENKWNPEYFLPTVEYYRDATARASSSDLVVWPEVASPARRWDEHQLVLGQLVRELRRETNRNGQSVAFGIFQFVSERGEAHTYNSVAMLKGNAPIRFYQKRHLVPFGEYFPVPGFVRDWMAGVSLNFQDMTPGDDVQPLLETASGVKVATAICYEDAYAAEQLYAFPDASLIVNVSNDGWFGDTIAPHQHLQIARMRSLEVGRPTVRSTPNGVSAFIDADGSIVERGPQATDWSGTRMVQPMTGSTPYVGWGNWPVILLCTLLIGFFWIRSRASL